MRAPDFWHDGTAALPARFLAPAAWLYDRAGRLRRACATPYRAAVPVICIGNLTAGGTGKTPLALAVAGALAARGLKPVFLTRGYGGREKGPLAVDTARHSAADIGDEPLLLARAHPTIVSRDRAAGAKAALFLGAEAIVMDDGFQNPSLHKDLAILAVDPKLGFGNGRVIPAGPLRESVARGLARADAVILLGEGEQPSALAGFTGSVLRARLLANDAAAAKFRGRRIIAFAGIGRPSKFFDSLNALGADVALTIPFPDHHPYSDDEIAQLKARAAGRLLVTTEKDFIRLTPAQRGGIETLPVHAVFDAPAAFEALIEKIICAQAEAARDPGVR